MSGRYWKILFDKFKNKLCSFCFLDYGDNDNNYNLLPLLPNSLCCISGLNMRQQRGTALVKVSVFLKKWRRMEWWLTATECQSQSGPATGALNQVSGDEQLQHEKRNVSGCLLHIYNNDALLQYISFILFVLIYSFLYCCYWNFMSSCNYTRSLPHCLGVVPYFPVLDPSLISLFRSCLLHPLWKYRLHRLC